MRDRLQVIENIAEQLRFDLAVAAIAVESPEEMLDCAGNMLMGETTRKVCRSINLQGERLEAYVAFPVALEHHAFGSCIERFDHGHEEVHEEERRHTPIIRGQQGEDSPLFVGQRLHSDDFRNDFRPHPDGLIDEPRDRSSQVADEGEEEEPSHRGEQQRAAIEQSARQPPEPFRAVFSRAPEHIRSEQHAYAAAADVEDEAFEVEGRHLVAEEVHVFPRGLEVHDQCIDQCEDEVVVVRPSRALARRDRHCGRRY